MYICKEEINMTIAALLWMFLLEIKHRITFICSMMY